jgi:translation elongation factor EF-G
MLDAVNRYLPSPLDINAIVGHKQCDSSVSIERQTNNDENRGFLSLFSIWPAASLVGLVWNARFEKYFVE